MGENNVSAFVLACFGNQLEIAAELLTKEINIERTIATCSIPIYVCHKGFSDIVRLLLNDPRSRVNVNRIGGEGFNALIMATMGGHIDCVRLLVGVPGIEVNRTFHYGMTALALALSEGREDIAQLLRDAGARDDASLLTRYETSGLRQFSENVNKAFSSFWTSWYEKK